MKKYPLEKLDAFTAGFSTGNPAALVALDRPDDITPEQMQRIAFELRGCVSEVGYVWPSPEPEADFELRYYSSEQEVPFCGHATVAILHRLISTTPALSSKNELHIRTRSSLLKVRNRVREENLVYIHAPEPVFTDTGIRHPEIATALDLPLADLVLHRQPALINVGQNILLVQLASKESCLRCRPDYQRIRQFCFDNRLEVVTIFALAETFPDSPAYSRVFPPVYGYLEDPATGSGNAALGYQLLRDGRWNGKPTVIEQGPDGNAPNLIHLRAEENRILIGGSAVCRFSGIYSLP
jgi:PhzF family phenazine biosynthesis protein